MKTELNLLAQVSTLTALLWLPYVLNRIVTRGLLATVGYPSQPKPLSPWAERLRLAHANAVENLAVFAALAAVAAGISTPMTVLAGQLYLVSRLVHAAAYTFGIPWVRTAAFTGGFVAQMMLASQLLA